MKSVMVRLPTTSAVKDFVAIAQKVDGNMDLVSGRFRIDAKSIMGIFSLDLSKPLQLQINTMDEEQTAQLFGDFICG